jgi:hypothetical protein
LRARGISAGIGRIRRWEWPPAFPLVQFPNPPLIIALLASAVASLTHDTGHRAARSVFFLALSVWAYEEAWHGANWFRRALGVGVAIYILITLTNALHG